jgi:hypothetical protein
MPTNPRDKMAELLRACARRRKEQAGAPFDLHPATRSMLQAEVARLTPRMKKAESRRISFLPRLIFAAAAAASIAICAIILFRSEPAPPGSSHGLAKVDELNRIPTTNNGVLLAPGGGRIDLAPASAPIAAIPPGSPGIRLSSTVASPGAQLELDMPAEGTGVGTFNSGGAVAVTSPITVVGAGAGASGGEGGGGGLDKSGGNAMMNQVGGAYFGDKLSQYQPGSDALTVPSQQPAPSAPSGTTGTFLLGDVALGAPAAPSGANADDGFENETARGAGMGGAGTGYIQNKLDHIIIPRVDFHDATVRDAIEFLWKKSIDFDTTEIDPEHKGVNIVLKLEPASPLVSQQLAAAASATNAPAELATRGMPMMPRVASPTAAATPPVSPADAKITLSLKNATLSEALRDVTALAGLKVQVESSAVDIVPLSENTEVLITREYKVPQGFFGGAIASNDNGKTTRGVTATDSAVDATSDAQKKSSPAPGNSVAVAYFRNAGVQFPAGADANFDPSSGKLIVRNTQENLDFVDKLVQDFIVSEREREVVEAKSVAMYKTMQVETKMAGPDVVLTTFQLQLEGDIVRIVDADGSVYTGKVEQPLAQKQLAVSNGRTFSNLLATRQQQQAVLKSDNAATPQYGAKVQQNSGMVTAGVSNNTTQANIEQANTGVKLNDMPQQNFTFRATGINRRLNKPVIFDGSYIAPDNGQQQDMQEKNKGAQDAEKGDKLKDIADEKAKEVEKAVPPPDDNARIEGEAQVGDSGTISIDAVVIPLKAKAAK